MKFKIIKTEVKNTFFVVWPETESCSFSTITK